MKTGKMADKKWLAISYCCIFISIYFLFIGYSAFSGFLKQEFNINTPQTISVNATTSAISSVSSWSGILLVVGIMAIILVILFNLIGFRAMGNAI